jgi:hypothetical protein
MLSPKIIKLFKTELNQFFYSQNNFILKMRTLEGLCETFIVDLIKTVLENRKHKVIHLI